MTSFSRHAINNGPSFLRKRPEGARLEGPQEKAFLQQILKKGGFWVMLASKKILDARRDEGPGRESLEGASICRSARGRGARDIGCRNGSGK